MSVYGKFSPIDARALFRCGEFAGPTSGISMGHVQANIVILPTRSAIDFHRFCIQNTRCCPLIGVSKAGDVGFDGLGVDIDMRRICRLTGYTGAADLTMKPRMFRTFGKTISSLLQSVVLSVLKTVCWRPDCRSGTSKRQPLYQCIAPTWRPSLPGCLVDRSWCRCGPCHRTISAARLK